MSYFSDHVKVFSKGVTTKIGFVGLGKSNLALLEEAQHLPSVDIYLRDSRKGACVPQGLPYKKCFFGENFLSDIEEDILFLSPSIRRDSHELSKARQRGTILSSDCDLFFQYNKTPAIGITGSDGKSTTTTLVSLLLKDTGYNARAVGNIGIPFIQAGEADVYATELSSFNLQYASPTLLASAITNITENHLNWHKSFEEYINAKKSILKNSRRTVMSPDDVISREIIKHSGASAVFSARYTEKELAALTSADVCYTLRNEKIERCGRAIADINMFKRKEEYNIKNAMCAIALCDGMVSDESFQRVLYSFTGLEHRCEEFLFHNGVRYIDSSIDTTPERTKETLLSLCRTEGSNVSIILGGRDKGLNFTSLIAPLKKYAVKISIYGDSRDLIAELLYQAGVDRYAKIGVFRDFADSVAYSAQDMRDGVVLLSPACTAYGEFSDFTERGTAFKRIISSMCSM